MQKLLKDELESRQIMIKVTEDIRSIIFILLSSAVLGALVGLPFILIYKGDLVINLLKSSLFGIGISVIAAPAFIFFYKYHTIWSMMAVFIVIGAGTFTGAFTSGITDITIILLIIFSAELAGMCFTVYSYLYYRKINKKLAQYQETLKTKER